MMGSFKPGNQYIQLVKVLYCKLPTMGKKLPSFPHRVQGLNQQRQRWEASVLPLCHLDPPSSIIISIIITCEREVITRQKVFTNAKTKCPTANTVYKGKKVKDE